MVYWHKNPSAKIAIWIALLLAYLRFLRCALAGAGIKKDTREQGGGENWQERQEWQERFVN